MFHMRGVTLAILAAGLLFGVLAVILARSQFDVQPPPQSVDGTQPAPPAPLSTIVVASRELGFGEVLTADDLREIAWPGDAIPEGAFAKAADVETASQRVVLSIIGPNEPVLAWKISGPGARASLSATLGAGMRAVTVRVNEYTGVAGFVLPGDRVDVLFTREQGSAEQLTSIIEILLQNVRVLAVNQVSDNKTAEPIVGSVVTLELTPVDAQKVALAQSTGAITLTLRGAGSIDAAPAQAIVENELVSNPSVYQAAFSAQAEAQAALEQRIDGLEGNISAVETKLTAKLDDADTSRRQLLQKLEVLEGKVKSTAEASGEGEIEFRGKLAALEGSIRDAISATGQGEEELRARLEAFEARLKQMIEEASASKAAPPAAAKPEPTTVELTVYRGVAGATITVPKDAIRR